LKELFLAETCFCHYRHEGATLDFIVSWHRNDILVFDKVNVTAPLPNNAIASFSQNLDYITPRKDWEIA
jgi:hypothetical protein